MSKPSVYAAMPLYSDTAHFAAVMTFGMCATEGGCDVVWKGGSISHPEQAFNTRWAEALNMRESHGLTHFAMLHSDVVPEPYWLDKLLALQELHDADLVSVVVPLKNEEGRTSTALFDPSSGKGGAIERTLTLSDVHALPMTFNNYDAGSPGRILLVNTGCFVCRFDRDWCPRVWARAITWIESGAGRGYEAKMIPSDWDFSVQLAKHGCKVLATRAVECYHGRPECTNARIWGTANKTEVA